MKKEGSAFDLPIAIGILVVAEFLPPEAVAGRLFVGELSLEGQFSSRHFSFEGSGSQFTDQINSQHLISIQGSYTTSSTLRAVGPRPSCGAR